MCQRCGDFVAAAPSEASPLCARCAPVAVREKLDQERGQVRRAILSLSLAASLLTFVLFYCVAEPAPFSATLPLTSFVAGLVSVTLTVGCLIVGAALGRFFLGRIVARSKLDPQALEELLHPPTRTRLAEVFLVFTPFAFAFVSLAFYHNRAGSDRQLALLFLIAILALQTTAGGVLVLGGRRLR